MSRRLPESWRAAALLASLFAATVALQMTHERGGGPPASTAPELLYVRSPEAVKRLALSYDALLADLYWIRALQHYGGTKLSEDADKSYDLLYPLLDLTTSLDPQFIVAYLFGAIFLAEPPPDGPGRPDLAIELLQKGLRQQPHRWELAQAVGFVHFWWRQDPRQAAHWFARAAELPNAPAWLSLLAAATLAEGGSREASRMLWQRIAARAENDWFRGESQRRLQQLDALDQLDALQSTVDEFRLRHGSQPADWAELHRAAYLPGLPIDPAGTPYRLESGVVELDPASPLHPLPAGPAQLR